MLLCSEEELPPFCYENLRKYFLNYQVSYCDLQKNSVILKGL